MEDNMNEFEWIKEIMDSKVYVGATFRVDMGENGTVNVIITNIVDGYVMGDVTESNSRNVDVGTDKLDASVEDVKKFIEEGRWIPIQEKKLILI